MRNDSKGSCWNQWDLHFHTPSSFDYGDMSVTNEEIIDGLLDAEIGAVAITDHHVMDVNRIHDLKQIAGDRLTVFPGIEFRSELGGTPCVHYIGVFPEDSDLEHVWTILKGNLDLTEKMIHERGGDQRVYVPFEKGAKQIQRLGGLVTVHSGRKSNSINSISNAEEFKQQFKTDLVRHCIDVLEVGQVRDDNEYKDKVYPVIGKHLPIIIASDNHNINKYSRPAKCWIKADRTFDGLRHVLHEPYQRVFLGEKPESLIRESTSPTRIIDSIVVGKEESASHDEHWFDCDIPLNSGLVAIIGNKGSGKSALSDIIGLLGDSSNQKSFSFLSSKRFCQPRNNLGKHFIGKIKWLSGGESSRSLDHSIADGTLESVRYLPQSHLEKICNELDSNETTQFSKELKAVIFSHVRDVDRLGRATLDELVDYKAEEIKHARIALKNSLDRKVGELAEIEKQLTERHRRSIEQAIEAKERDLKAHDALKPEEVKKPEIETKEAKQQREAIEKKIAVLNKKVSDCEMVLSSLAAQQEEHTKRRAAADRLLTRMSRFEQSVNNFLSESETDCQQLRLRPEQLISVWLNRPEVQMQDANSQTHLAKIEHELDSASDSSPSKLIENNKAEIEELQNKLEEADQNYQKYIKEHATWTAKRSEIIGTPTKVDSLEYLKNGLNTLASLPQRLIEIKDECIELSVQIFEQIRLLEDQYRSLYHPVQHFIETHPLATNFSLGFETSIVENGFSEKLLSHINQSRKGSFSGSTEGNEKAQAICKSADFQSSEGVRAFLNNVFDHLHSDKRTESATTTVLLDQLGKSSNAASLYDYLFGLEYLNPDYTLSWSKKSISELSPGERGTLLLVFYLLIDKDDTPLLLDQPEENLDNQTVYDVLVPSLKVAKARRQVIVVTHNPNLAVVCDADQVIHATIDKNDKNRVTYTFGAIENPKINRHLVDILEGTWPAFDNRHSKYMKSASPWSPLTS